MIETRQPIDCGGWRKEKSRGPMTFWRVFGGIGQRGAPKILGCSWKSDRKIQCPAAGAMVQFLGRVGALQLALEAPTVFHLTPYIPYSRASPITNIATHPTFYGYK